MTEMGRSFQFASWLNHEFETLQALHAVGADVPQPLARSEEALLLEYIGEDEQPAPQLSSISLTGAEAGPLFERLRRNFELWLGRHLIHADLSPFNILYWRRRLTVIDFPQAVDARFNPNAYALLQRDLENVCRYFARHGVRADADRLADHLWRRFMRAAL